MLGDKFVNKPLVPGDTFVDIYLATRQGIDARLPAGADRTLSFAEFVDFCRGDRAVASDVTLQAQDDILNIPGLPLDFVGKVEIVRRGFRPCAGPFGR